MNSTTKPLSKKAQKEANKANAIAELKNLLPHGTTVYTSNAKVARTNMQAWLKLFIVKDGEILSIAGKVSDALGLRWKDGTVLVHGCGMDRGFHIVMNLSYALHGHESHGDKAHNKPTPDNMHAGYTLRHEWI